MLKEKNTLIIGARSGIGLETMKCFAKNEANIYACVRKTDKEFLSICEDLEKNHKTKISILNFDVNDLNQTKEKLSKINEVDVYVNTAAIIDFSLFEMSGQKKINEIFNTNFFSQVNTMQIVVKKMKKKGGSIINLSSSVNIEKNIGSSFYASSKAALETLSKVMSRELGRYKIRVNVVQPGLVETKAMREKHSDEMIEQQLKKLSLKEVIHPKEVANLILFLACDDSKNITGQVIKINCGI